MAEIPLSTDEKAERLQKAYDAFMSQLRGLESERLEVMKRVIGELEREEIERLLQEMKE